MTFYRFIQKGILFVIRIKDEDSSTSILRHYPTPDEDEYDIDFDVILTDKNNSHVKAHWDTYKYISHYKKEPEFDGSVHELELHGRVVRYTAVSEGKETHFTVLTNLSRDQFSTEDIREIYHLRWQEEISFRDLNHKIDLDTVHFRKLERIEAEIFAKLTVYNLMSCVRNALEKRINKAEKRRKYEYRIDFAFLTDVCRAYLFRKRIPANLDHLLLSRQQPVRPGRSDRRKKRYSVSVAKSKAH